jgi:hypothetical protein
MSVLSFPVQVTPGPAAAPRPVPWHRMIWVTWRQHRGMLTGLTAVYAAASVFLLIAGLQVHHAYAAVANCHPAISDACTTLNNNFGSTYWTMANTMLIFMNLAPALVGAFAGGSVLAAELENGTFRYAWTQGIGRVRWTIAKLTLLAVVITVFSWAFSQLFAWFLDPFLGNSAGFTVLAKTIFDTRGTDFAAWTLLAFTVGAFLGMLIRRTVPAMAATLGVYLALALLAWLVLRENYPVAINTSGGVPLNTSQSTSTMPWILKTWTVGTTDWTRYIPVSRFWPMQFIESGWLLLLSVLLIAATVWLVRRRAA